MQAFIPSHAASAEQGWIELVTCWAWVLVRADGETAAVRSRRSEALSQAVMRFLDSAPQSPGGCFLAVGAEGDTIRTWWPSEEACGRFQSHWLSCLAEQDEIATIAVDLIGNPGTADQEIARSPMVRQPVATTSQRLAC